jgi:hypothetical protein
VREAIDRGLPDPYDVPGYTNVRSLLRGIRAAFIELARDEIRANPQSREEPLERATLPRPPAGSRRALKALSNAPGGGAGGSSRLRGESSHDGNERKEHER